MKVKIKKTHPNAVIPKYSRQGDAGLDLTAVDCKYISFYTIDYLEYDTGLSFEIPEGYVGLIFPRSSQSNVNQLLSNHVGVLDSNFRGTVKFRFKDIVNDTTVRYKIGDRIGQLIILPYPQIQFEEVGELSETERGENGFGSSGK